MQQTATQLAIQTAFTILWIGMTAGILLAGQWSARARGFRDGMLRQWKAALAIALLHELSALAGGIGFQFSSIRVFCEAMIGLALAYSITGYEPLPVTQALTKNEKAGEQLIRMLGAALAVAGIAITMGIFEGVLLSRFGETMSNSQSWAKVFPGNAWQSFFLLLAGAGIAEETVYRLVCVSLFWRLTRRPWIAVLLSSVLFGLYHLSPLDAFYRQYWERPITILIASIVMGGVMGYIYLKRGYETAVLGHTLGDWIPLLLARIA